MTANRATGGLPPETLAAIRIVFFQECEEHLAAIGSGLRALQDGDADPDTVKRVHRALHSIKGAAGIFDLEALAGFAGAFEAVLVEIRDGRLEAGPETLVVLGQAAEVLNELIQAGRDCRTADPDHAAPVLERLAALAPQAGEPEPFEGLDFRPRPMAFQPLGPSAGVRPRRRGKA
jgi:two-component system, chemotaxis family, sensor kinase CheA